MLIHNKDDIEFVTEFPCFLGHPVYLNCLDYMGDIESKAALKSGRLPSSLSSSARPISISLPFITLISFFYIYL